MTREETHPLAPLQQGMLVEALNSPGTGVYVGQFCWDLEGPVEPRAMRLAWGAAVRRHTALRTRFVWEGVAEPRQVFVEDVEVPWAEADWRGQEADAQEAALREHFLSDRALGFVLDRAPLMRVRLIRVADDRWKLFWTHHHLILDGWSLPIVMNDVARFYGEAVRTGAIAAVSPAPPYSRHVTWLQAQDAAAAETYWRHLLAGFDSPTRLAPRAPRAAGLDAATDIQYCDVRLSLETTRRLEQTARRLRLTLNTLIGGAWALLVSRYTDRDDVVFGSTTAGRPVDLPGVEQMVGLFINTLPVRFSIEPRDTVVESLSRLQRQQAESRRFEYAPLLRVQEWSEIGSGDALFDTVFSFERYPGGGDNQRFAGVRLGALTARTTDAYPVTAVAMPGPQLRLHLAYNQRVFDSAATARMMEHWRRVLEAFATPTQPMRDVQMLSDAEHAWAVTQCNRTEAGAIPELVTALIETQAAAIPDAVAIRGLYGTITYGELNRRGNRLAHRLRELGVGPESRVAVCAERDPLAIVALLGVLKAGAAFVPLDPEYPADRLTYMLEDARVTFLITHSHLLDLFAGAWVDLFCLDTDWHLLTDGAASDVAAGVRPENLAYIIYTSGSTGQPKGTMVEHGALSSLVVSQIVDLRLTQGTPVVHTLSFAFDASITTWINALAAGATLVLPPADSATGEALHRWMIRTHVEVLSTVPGVLRSLPADDLPTLKTIAVGGETCAPELVARWAQGRTMVNVYGATECTVLSTVATVVPGEPITIGSPRPNVSVHVLDRQLRPAPAGVEGELYIGGLGLARGYVNQPGPTAGRFVADPLGRPGARLYRTGDRGFRRDDGRLEFIGRSDAQIKIRGFRVEPAEIEAVLRQQGDVADVAVVAQEGASGDRTLVAYVVAGAEESGSRGSVDLDSARHAIARQLPQVMMPARFAVLDALPRTASGKVDRAALSAREVLAPEQPDGRGPRTPLEEILCGLFATTLGVDRVGLDDSFFDLGGHSLLATQLVSRIRRATNAELELRRVFETPTVAALAATIEPIMRAGGSVSIPPPSRAMRGATVPASYAQQRLWFIDRLESGSPAYNTPGALRLNGPLVVDAFEKAFAEVIRRHEVLRTHFDSHDGQPIQIISPRVRCRIEKTDLGGFSREAREGELARLAEAETRRPFDLQLGPLLRARLVALTEREHALLLTLHHSISDGWSQGILLRELAALYAAFVQGKPSPLPALEIQYADYAIWQRRWLEGDALADQRDYWMTRLEHLPATTLPRMAWGSSGSIRTADLVPIDLPAPLMTDLRRLSTREGATLFMVLLAAFQVVLSRWSGQDDVVVGTDVAARRWSEIEPLIGCFVNQLVLRTDVGGDPTVAALIARARETCLGAYAHQDFPFERLVEELNPRRSLARTPLFQVKLLLQNVAPLPHSFADLEVTPVTLVKPGAQFDLLLNLRETGGRLSGQCVYVTELYSADTVQQMLRHWMRVLEAMVEDPDRRLSSIEMAEVERAAIETFTAAPLATRATVPVHRAFETQTERIPDAVAIVCGDRMLTYGELNRRSNQLARLLRELGVGEEVRVAICVPRRAEAIIATVATAKACGVIVPLDTEYPPERLAMLLEDAAVSVLITDETTLSRVPLPHGLQTLCVDVDWPEAARQPADVLPDSPAANAAAYIIYTSGSTGRPKGVVVSHGSHAMVTRSLIPLYRLAPGARLMQSVSFAFDVAVADWSTVLASGATLMLAPDHARSGPALAAELRRTDATVAPVPMSVLAMTGSGEVPALETVLTGGEMLSPDVAGRWARGRQMVNFYGVTECTVSSTADRISPERPPTIGRPLPHAAVHVLDDLLVPVPIGVAGELYVGGPAVARGYLNAPGRTAERFVADPWGLRPGARLYRTGDRVRWGVDGLLQFMGRVDDQVQIRGHRVEPGEVAAVLQQHPGVCAAAVLAVVREGVAELVGYVVPATVPMPPTADLRRYLEERLPPSMVPARFVAIDAMPLTANGKIDRAALPSAAVSILEEYVPPDTEHERRLAAIWSALLPGERIGARDNFFERGGHSLLAAQLVGRVQAAFGVELPLRTVFEAPVLRDMAAEICSMTADAEPLALAPVPRTSPLPASPAQRRLWLLEQMHAGNAAYNIPLALHLAGPLDPVALAASLRAIVERHEVLRTTFRSDSAGVWQEVGDATLDLPIVDLRHLATAGLARHLARTVAFRPFVLEGGRLLRALLIRLADDAHVLLLTMHHVVADGASRGILIGELMEGYEARREGRLPRLVPLSVQYGDYAAWQQQRLTPSLRREQLAYWRETLDGAPLLPLPTDKEAPRTGVVGGRLEVVVPAPRTAALRRMCEERSLTPFMALFAITQLALADWAGETDVVVGVDASGRGEPALEPLIGYFVNVLPIRTRVERELTAAELLENVRRAMVDAYCNDDVPFDVLVQQLDPVRSERLNPFFDVVVSYEQRGTEQPNMGDLRMAAFPLGRRIPKYPFEVKMVHTAARISVGIHYDADLFSDSAIARFADRFVRFTEALIEDPGATLGTVLDSSALTGETQAPLETLYT